MITKLSVVTILVQDQDEALLFYTEKLGFEKRADLTFGQGLRWVTVAPKEQKEVEITLLLPSPSIHGEEGAKALMEQVGKNPTWSFTTDNCRETYEMLQARGVTFLSEPQQQMYGVEAVFQDLYGNTFSLLEPAPQARTNG